jgi:hypothetical protein
MEGHELLGGMNKVKAPADFDESVFAKLGEARRTRLRRRAAFRYAFAGSAALVLIGFVLLNVRLVNSRSPRIVAGGGSETARTYMPILETVDYSSEYRSASSATRTVYILEQVSEIGPTEIRF